jgi:hypothetical protein
MGSSGTECNAYLSNSLALGRLLVGGRTLSREWPLKDVRILGLAGTASHLAMKFVGRVGELWRWVTD